MFSDLFGQYLTTDLDIPDTYYKVNAGYSLFLKKKIKINLASQQLTFLESKLSMDKNLFIH